MSAERWRQVDRCFARAAELPSTERARFLEHECGDDSELRREVRALLEADAAMNDFLERPACGSNGIMRQLDQEQAPLLRPGDMVDHFEVLERLGHGGMGEVYLAQDSMLGRQVALKVLPAQWCSSALARQRLLAEARMTAMLNHPSIITIHAVGEDRGSPYLALEYIDGRTLRDRLQQGPLDEHELLTTGLAIAEALREAHRHGVLHLDLKPGNIMLDRNGGLRLLDFGVAEAVRSPGARCEQHRSTRSRPSSGGTPAYMAPEQWQGACSPATDVWALGLLLLEMLTGSHPWAGLDITEINRRVEQISAGVQVPERYWSAQPELARLIEACLRRDQEQRPSAETIVSVLSGLLAARQTPRSVVACDRSSQPLRAHRCQPRPPAVRETALPTMQL